MLVSIVLCTYRSDSYENVLDAASSLLNQTYPDIEIIIVVDGNRELRQKITEIYHTRDNIRVIASEESIGACGVRNLGIGEARGDIIAFLDDDSVADKRWVEGIIDTYQKNDAVAVGGVILPIWVAGKPDHLPEELYWLVGLTHEGFAGEGITEVRNTFAGNSSFKREVFEKVGLFDQKFSFTGKEGPLMQGEEAQFNLRMRHKMGRGVIYNPGLLVYHKISPGKTKLGTLLRRAFYQGYSKALLKKVSPVPQPLATEQSYLKDLLSIYIPGRIKRIFSGSHPQVEIKQFLVLVASILAVGLGYGYGLLKSSER